MTACRHKVMTPERDMHAEIVKDEAAVAAFEKDLVEVSALQWTPRPLLTGEVEPFTLFGVVRCKYPNFRDPEKSGGILASTIFSST